MDPSFHVMGPEFRAVWATDDSGFSSIDPEDIKAIYLGDTKLF